MTGGSRHTDGETSGAGSDELRLAADLSAGVNNGCIKSYWSHTHNGVAQAITIGHVHCDSQVRFGSTASGLTA
jgi:hypothetical protein